MITAYLTSLYQIKSMTLYQYKRLTEADQFDVLWNYGEFLLHRETSLFKFILYQVDGFYVEVRYEVAKNEIVGLRSFFSTSNLDPYLEQIDCSALYNFY